VLFPHLVDGNRRGQLELVPIVHDGLEFHELTVSLEDAPGKSFTKSVNSHASFDERSGATSGLWLSWILSTLNLPPGFDLGLLAALLGPGFGHPDAAIVHNRGCHGCRLVVGDLDARW
jgi:hypothetical protein